MRVSMEQGVNIFFVKTAKCGTETIRKYLLEYAKQKKLILNNGRYNNYFKNETFNINVNHIHRNEKTVNHFNQHKDKELSDFYLSAIRNPIDRLYSHYHFGNEYLWDGMDFNEWYQGVVKGELDTHKNDGWSAARWGDKTNNYISSYMEVESSQEMVDIFDHIFIAEKFETSLRTFEDKLKVKLDRINDENVGKHKPQEKIIEKETIDLFNENNQLDLELYEKAFTSY